VAALALVIVIARRGARAGASGEIEKTGNRRAAGVLLRHDRPESRAIMQDLLKIAHQNPQAGAGSRQAAGVMPAISSMVPI